VTTTDDDLFAHPGQPRPADKLIRGGRYYLPHPDSGRETGWTRASTFAKTIADNYILNLWGRRMSIKGVSLRPDLLALTAATPLTDRDTLNDIAERAADFAGAKVGAALGTALHGFTEQHDRGEKVTAPDQYRPDLAAYVRALAEHGVEVVSEYIERVIIVPRFGVAGRLDRVFRVVRDCRVELPGVEPFTLSAGQLILGDLKTGRDLSYGWGEIGIQLALYANATALWNETTEEYEPPPDIDKRVAVVVHLPVGEAKCTLFDLNIQMGWEAATLCEQVRAWRRERGLAVARLKVSAELAAGQTITDVEDPAGWAVRIDTARTVADLSSIWSEAFHRGQWTDELQARGMARRALILADTRGETSG
jgi:hypothetical protein